MKVEFPANMLRIEDDTILLVGYSKGSVVVDQENLVAIRRYIRWRFFVQGKSIEEVSWKDLTDNQRMIIRNSVVWTGTRGEHLARNTTVCPGEYTDDRYYTLEALVENH